MGCTPQLSGVLTSLFDQPAVPWSPLKDELRRKYLTQVDLLLQDASVFEVPASSHFSLELGQKE
jgi:hypothetical protein